MKKQWTNDRIKEVLQLIANGKSTSQVADVMNDKYGTSFSGDAVRSGLNRWGFSATGKPKEEELKDGKILKQTQEVKGDTVVAEVESLFKTKRQLTDKELLTMAGLDPKIFVVDRVKGSKWSVISNKHGQQWNYYTSVIAKRKQIDYDAILDYMDKHIKPFPIKDTIRFDNRKTLADMLPADRYLVVPCFDTLS